MTTLPQPLRDVLRYLAAPGPDRARGRHCFDARGRSAQRLVALGLGLIAAAIGVGVWL